MNVLICSFAPLQWGSDLHSEHEQHLVNHFNNQPVFVTEFPLKLKPFYARSKDDDSTLVRELIQRGLEQMM